MSNLVKTDAPKTVKATLTSDYFKKQVELVQSKYVTPERFVRIALTALLKTPKLENCTPASVVKCCLTCAQIGVEPDGRNAHLIPYGNECTLIVDWKGYVAIAKRNGLLVSAKLVHEKDEFDVMEDDGTGRTKVVHKVNYTQERGDVVAVYSRAVDGTEIDYEIMSRGEVEYVRNAFSRAKDADAWKKSWGEMAKKTCIRRHSKRWNLDVDMDESEPLTVKGKQESLISEVGAMETPPDEAVEGGKVIELAAPTAPADEKGPDRSGQAAEPPPSDEQAEAQLGLAPASATEPAQQSQPTQGAPATTKPARGANSTAQGELMKMVTSWGFNFNHFAKWGEASGNVPNATSFSMWDEIPEKDAKRLLRARTGLLDGLKRSSPEVQVPEGAK